MTKSEIIKLLKLESHPIEGGYFKRTYESNIRFESEAGERRVLTSIYYMLTSDNQIGYMHKNKSDIIHYYHLGAPTTYHLISPEGEYYQRRLGPD
ncbi:MAG: cupin domain-containing protein, partial [Kangiellaceae bacterium]|nr:cupin domain-containing protein [Kangiellaceae bacterium]